MRILLFSSSQNIDYYCFICYNVTNSIEKGAKYMKIKNNSDIVKIIEEFYHDRNQLYYNLFDKALEYENSNERNIQF